MKRTVRPAAALRGEITVPGDKSISHRAMMIGGICEGITEIEGFSNGEDPWRTVSAMRALGVEVEEREDVLRVHGVGLHGLKPPETEIDAGNAGTMMRLLSGILAGQRFETVLTGDEYLRHRSMRRIIEPLRGMGAEISGVEDQYPPLRIRGRELTPIRYDMPISSAQVKSCILFAGLYAQGRTSVIERAASRDHTERMLNAAGAKIERSTLRDREGAVVSIEGEPTLEAQRIEVPGDLSAAAFFLVAATLVPRSEVILRNVGLNPTRRGVVETLRRMGARVTIENERTVCGEPMGDLLVKSSSLKRIRIAGDLIPNVIDEIPILAIAATQVPGEVIIRDAADLRAKETDRISAMVENLRRMGAKVGEMPDGLIVEGGYTLQGAEIDSFGDHRIAMAFAIAGLLAQDEVVIDGAEWVDTSFPGFFDVLESLRED